MNKIKQLTEHNLSARLTEQSTYALAKGALHTLPTQYEIHHDHGVDFIVRILHNLQRKLDDKDRLSKAAGNKPYNPFLPYEDDMYVGHISSSHVCILNKFNIIDNHLLIITQDYQSQEELLNADDFNALHFCLNQIDGLGFYNAGKIAGASQHHKHLQVIPLPLAPGWCCAQGFRLPVEAVLYNKVQQPFIFAHEIYFFDEHEFSVLSGEQLFSIYQTLMRKICRWPADDSGKATAPYNFLCTRNWMMLVPRTRECANGMSVNSMGFSGALLVKNQQDLQRLLATGPMQALITVTR